jgi:hypothetical protein
VGNKGEGNIDYGSQEQTVGLGVVLYKLAFLEISSMVEQSRVLHGTALHETMISLDEKCT